MSCVMRQLRAGMSSSKEMIGLLPYRGERDGNLTQKDSAFLQSGKWVGGRSGLLRTCRKITSLKMRGLQTCTALEFCLHVKKICHTACGLNFLLWLVVGDPICFGLTEPLNALDIPELKIRS